MNELPIGYQNIVKQLKKNKKKDIFPQETV
jgi:hypothetical protein